MCAAAGPLPVAACASFLDYHSTYRSKPPISSSSSGKNTRTWKAATGNLKSAPSALRFFCRAARGEGSAGVVELVDTRDLKSLGPRLYGFESRRPHHILLRYRPSGYLSAVLVRSARLHHLFWRYHFSGYLSAKLCGHVAPLYLSLRSVALFLPLQGSDSEPNWRGPLVRPALPVLRGADVSGFSCRTTGLALTSCRIF